MFTGVNKECVPLIWPKIEPIIQRILDVDKDRYDTNDILDEILDGILQVWIGSENDEIEVVVLTKIVPFKKKNVVFIEMLGGKNLYNWINNIDIIKQWGTENNCESIEIIGRPGFRKILKDFNFKEKRVIYEAQL